MKITILDPSPGEEDEIIVKCRALDEDTLRFINRFKAGSGRVTAYKDGSIVKLKTSDILYFESVDERVFVYTDEDICEVKTRLYELEKELPDIDFMRAGKSLIINLSHVKSLSPAFSGRFEALMTNGEKVVISRQYVPVLKDKLGL